MSKKWAVKSFQSKKKMNKVVWAPLRWWYRQVEHEWDPTKGVGMRGEGTVTLWIVYNLFCFGGVVLRTSHQIWLWLLIIQLPRQSPKPQIISRTSISAYIVQKMDGATFPDQQCKCVQQRPPHVCLGDGVDCRRCRTATSQHEIFLQTSRLVSGVVEHYNGRCILKSGHRARSHAFRL